MSSKDSFEEMVNRLKHDLGLQSSSNVKPEFWDDQLPMLHMDYENEYEVDETIDEVRRYVWDRLKEDRRKAHLYFGLDPDYNYRIKDVDSALKQARGQPVKRTGQKRGPSQKAFDRRLRIVRSVVSIKDETQLKGTEFWERAAEHWNEENPKDVIKAGNLKTQYYRAIQDPDILQQLAISGQEKEG